MYVQDKERASVYIYEWEWYCQYETSLSKLHASLQVMSMLIRSNGAAVPGTPPHLSRLPLSSVGSTTKMWVLPPPPQSFLLLARGLEE